LKAEISPNNADLNLQLLIADDSTEVRHSLRRFLSTLEGLEIVGEAVDAVDALEQTRQLKPDIVLLDIKMPRGNGLDVAARIRQDLPSCEIIILTNYASKEFRRSAAEKGVRYFFDKSTEFEVIPSVIKKLLDEHTSS